MWENAYGYLQKGQTHNVVTSGVGVFGPYMRVGTKAEICAVRVGFNGCGAWISIYIKKGRLFFQQLLKLGMEAVEKSLPFCFHFL